LGIHGGAENFCCAMDSTGTCSARFDFALPIFGFEENEFFHLDSIH